MNLKITALVMVIAIAFTAACKKKKSNDPSDETPETPASYSNYSQLKPGNYWIYERFKIEQQGQTSSLNQFDSCYISKDTLINGRTFYKLHSFDFIYNMSRVSYLRDSLHYLVASNGTIFFSSEDFSSVFSTFYSIEQPSGDTVYKLVRKMNDKDVQVTTPAGAFTTSNMQSVYIMYKYSNPPVNNPRYLNTRYAKNIGKISETEQFYSSATYVTEKRLIRYHLN